MLTTPPGAGGPIPTSSHQPFLALASRLRGSDQPQTLSGPWFPFYHGWGW